MDNKELQHITYSGVVLIATAAVEITLVCVMFFTKSFWLTLGSGCGILLVPYLYSHYRRAILAEEEKEKWWKRNCEATQLLINEESKNKDII